MTSSLSAYQLVLFGCGQMGSAIVQGLADAGTLAPDQIICLDAVASKAEDLAQALGGAHTSLESVPRKPRLFLLAVKPHQVGQVLDQTKLESEDIVISVAAGVTWSNLESWSGPLPRIVRTMPNTPCLVGEGVVGLFAPPTHQKALDVASLIFSPISEVVVLSKESLFDGLTAISGSGPATMFVILEALADAGVMQGLDRETSRKLAACTMKGAAVLALQSPLHTAALKDAVTSPGGTTIASVRELERGGVRSALMGSVEAAANRSRAMSDEM